jgi:hypothetical protein
MGDVSEAAEPIHIMRTMVGTQKLTRAVLIIALSVFAATACIKSPPESQKPPYEVEPTLGDLNYATIRVFFATDRNRRKSAHPSNMFGVDRGPVTYGTCDVSIPRDHRMGVLESPSFLKLEFHGDPEKHVLLLRISIDSTQKYFADVASRIKESSKKMPLFLCMDTTLRLKTLPVELVRWHTT